MREMLTVRFDRLASHLFLVVGREIHGESFVIAVSWMWNVRMRVIASLSLIKQTRPSSAFTAEGRLHQTK